MKRFLFLGILLLEGGCASSVVGTAELQNLEQQRNKTMSAEMRVKTLQANLNSLNRQIFLEGEEQQSLERQLLIWEKGQ